MKKFQKSFHISFPTQIWKVSSRSLDFCQVLIFRANYSNFCAKNAILWLFESKKWACYIVEVIFFKIWAYTIFFSQKFQFWKKKRWLRHLVANKDIKFTPCGKFSNGHRCQKYQRYLRWFFLTVSVMFSSTVWIELNLQPFVCGAVVLSIVSLWLRRNF